jgi:hypothetical protein
MHNPIIKYIYRSKNWSIEDCGQFFAVMKEGWKHIASFKDSKLAMEYVLTKEKEML